MPNRNTMFGLLLALAVGCGGRVSKVGGSGGDGGEGEAEAEAEGEPSPDPAVDAGAADVLHDDSKPDATPDVTGDVLSDGDSDAGCVEGSPCDDGFFCTTGDTCTGGTCAGTGAPPCPDDGLACTFCDETTDTCNVLDPNACLIDGACRTAGEINPINDCEECTVSDPLFWTARAILSPCGDSADTVCDNPDSCDGMGTCLDNYEPASTECRADAGECDVAEFCDGAGACLIDAFEPPLTACGDGADTECTNADSCDGLGSCLPRHELPLTPCGDGTDTTCDNPDACDGAGECQANHEPPTMECRVDVGECDVAEFCDGAGACPADGFEPALTPCGDTDDTDCDNADSCDGTGVCDPRNEPDAMACDDGQFCTTVDACASGVCAGAGPPPCADDGIACTTTCDEAQDACNAIAADSCLIDGACYAAGAAHPCNPCQECSPASSTSSWIDDDANTCPAYGCFASPGACSAGVCDYSPQANCVTTVHDGTANPQAADGVTSIAIGRDCLPVIAYPVDTSGLELYVAKCGDAGCSTSCGVGGTTCSRMDGGPGGLDSSGFDPSIAIGVDGNPIVAFVNRKDAIVDAELTVAHCLNPSCTCATTPTTPCCDSGGAECNVVAGGISQGSDFQRRLTSIAIGDGGRPTVAYAATTTELRVAYCGDNTCSIGCGLPGGATCSLIDSWMAAGPGDSAIQVRADGLPLVAYYSGNNGNLRVADCGDVMCSTGNVITELDTPTLGDSPQVGPWVSLALGPTGTPVMSYYDAGGGGDLKVARCGDDGCSTACGAGGTSCTTVHGAGIDAGLWTAIGFLRDGRPIVAYQEQTGGDDNLWVAACGDEPCPPCGTGGTVCTIVDSGPEIGEHASLAIGSDGLPVISYSRNSFGGSTDVDLKVVKCATETCGP